MWMLYRRLIDVLYYIVKIGVALWRDNSRGGELDLSYCVEYSCAYSNNAPSDIEAHISGARVLVNNMLSLKMFAFPS